MKVVAAFIMYFNNNVIIIRRFRIFGSTYYVCAKDVGLEFRCKAVCACYVFAVRFTCECYQSTYVAVNGVLVFFFIGYGRRCKFGV